LKKLVFFLFFLYTLTFILSAHPFGYLRVDSVNQLALSPEKITLQAMVRLPEASAFPQLKIMDKNENFEYTEEEKEAYMKEVSPKFVENIIIKINDIPLKFEIVESSLNVSPAMSGLSTMKIIYLLEADIPGDLLKTGENKIYFKDDNFTSTPGWKEIQIKGKENVIILNAPERPKNIADALQTEVDLVFTLPEDAVVSVDNGDFTEPNIPDTQGEKGLVELISGEDLSPGIVFFALGIAVVLGALHAFAPGHGKTIVAAYLIGSRGTVRHAVMLGIIVTFTHTISVILLGLICLFAFRYVMPEKLYPWIGFASGILISVIGLWLLLARRSEPAHSHGHNNSHDHSHDHKHEDHSHDHKHEDHDHDHKHEGHSHDHSHDHKHEDHDHDHKHEDHDHDHKHEDHDHDHKHEGHSHDHSHDHKHEDHDHSHHHEHPHSHAHGHSHDNHDHKNSDSIGHYHGGKYHVHKVPDKITLYGLLALGISGGIVPCPDALVVLLSAIALNRILLGLLVIVAFSFGLAAVLIAIGIVMVTAGKLLQKYYPKRTFLNRLSSLSYAIIFILGLIIALQSLTSAGILTIQFKI